jgi:signal transduction histidine kinase
MLNMMMAISSEIGQFTHRRSAEAALRKAHDELEMRVQQRTAELKAANIKLHAAISDRKRLEHELLEITEKERRRIALDLHDDLGQKLSGIAMMTKGLQLRLGKTSPGESEEAGQIHELVQEAMNHASDLAHDLATLDLKANSLADALEGLAAHAAKLFGISCKLKVEGPAPALDSNSVRQLYKIAQESVTNAIKHGKAKKVSIELSATPAELELRIQNSGIPFPDLKSREGGMGLRIMHYRASLLNGTFDIKGQGAKGTLVTCTVPLSEPVTEKVGE